MNLEEVICCINRSINKKQPKSLNDKWIKYRCKTSHKYIVDNVKTEFDETDWGLVISRRDRSSQKIWMKGVN